MLALLDIFFFEANDVAFQQLSHKLKYGWKKQQRLGNNPLHQSTHGHSHDIEISGTLILESIHALTLLELIAEQKRPVTLVLPGTWKIYRVVITDIDIDKDKFLPGGEEVRKKFKIKLERYFG